MTFRIGDAVNGFVGGRVRGLVGALVLTFRIGDAVNGFVGGRVRGLVGALVGVRVRGRVGADVLGRRRLMLCRVLPPSFAICPLLAAASNRFLSTVGILNSRTTLPALTETPMQRRSTFRIFAN
jgi:hypothetical protein